MQERYQVEYEKQKPDKKLRYLSNMGSVELTVEMDSGETLSAAVNPLQAAIIELFSQQSKRYIIFIAMAWN
jgi:anaphase-promoting complex subunit 2